MIKCTHLNALIHCSLLVPTAFHSIPCSRPSPGQCWCKHRTSVRSWECSLLRLFNPTGILHPKPLEIWQAQDTHKTIFTLFHESAPTLIEFQSYHVGWRNSQAIFSRNLFLPCKHSRASSWTDRVHICFQGFFSACHQKPSCWFWIYTFCHVLIFFSYKGFFKTPQAVSWGNVTHCLCSSP